MSTAVTVYRDDTPWRVDQQVRALKRAGQESALHMGEKLYEVVLFKHYRALGHPSFESYCGDIGISRSLGYKLAAIHEIFVLRFQCPFDRLLAAESNKLGLLVAQVNNENITDPEDLDGWLWTAETNSNSDFRKELKAAFGSDAPDFLDYRQRARAWKRIAQIYYHEWRENNDGRSIRHCAS
jgi:hypothetical protein